MSNIKTNNFFVTKDELLERVAELAKEETYAIVIRPAVDGHELEVIRMDKAVTLENELAAHIVKISQEILTPITVNTVLRTGAPAVRVYEEIMKRCGTDVTKTKIKQVLQQHGYIIQQGKPTEGDYASKTSVVQGYKLKNNGTIVPTQIP